MASDDDTFTLLLDISLRDGMPLFCNRLITVRSLVLPHRITGELKTSSELVECLKAYFKDAPRGTGPGTRLAASGDFAKTT